MKTLNSLSGGRTSSYMAVHYPADVNIFACVCIDYEPAKPKDKAILNYCLDKLDGEFIASAESEKTLKVLMQLEQKIGKDIIWVRGKSFDDVIDGAGCLPTWARRFCTTDLKILPIFEYAYFNYGFMIERIGFRYDEPWRAYNRDKKTNIIDVVDLFGDMQKVTSVIKSTSRKKKAVMTDYPIRQIIKSKYHKRENIHWANKEYPLLDDKIDLKIISKYWNAISEFDFPHESNCAGCHHKSPVIISRQFDEEPAIMEWFSLQEEKGKYNTWHDDIIPYRIKKELNFTQLINLTGSGSCDSGYCTD